MRQFIMKRILLTTCGLLGICAVTFAQTRQLTGKITGQDNQGIVSATVKVKTAKNATIQMIRKANRTEGIDNADQIRELLLNNLLEKQSPSNAALSYIKNEVSQLW